LINPPQTLQEAIDLIVYHRAEKETHEKREKELKDYLKNAMEAEGIDKIASSNGRASLGKEQDNYSVPWQSLPENEAEALIEWALANGMKQNVNSTSFSAFIRALIESGKLKREELPEHITHYTVQRLNVVGN